MGNCISCGHEFERHLFGGMCFYCDCKRAVYDTSAPVFLEPHNTGKKRRASKNGTDKDEKEPRQAPRLGNK
jgi:hypothetical protein